MDQPHNLLRDRAGSAYRTQVRDILIGSREAGGPVNAAMFEKPPVLGEQECAFQELWHIVKRHTVIKIPAVFVGKAQRLTVAVRHPHRLHVGNDIMQGLFDRGKRKHRAEA